MSYSTPHHVRDYAIGAALAINHAYCIQCNRRTEGDRRSILSDTREIDLCARLGTYFGFSSRLNAQGSDEADVVTESPPFEIEVKYIFPGRTNWGELSADWEWLRAFTNNGGLFRRRALIWFWPSIELYRVTQCISVTRDRTAAYSEERLAPFWPFMNVELPPHGANQRLMFAEPDHQGPHAIRLPNGRRVAIDIVGSVTHPLWASVYTRLTPDEYAQVPTHRQTTVRATAFDIQEWTT
jgi:hypothetical protein